MSQPEPLHAAEYPTPFGPLAVLVTAEDGVVRASGFQPVNEIAERLAPHYVARGWVLAPLHQVAVAVAAWLDGDGHALSSVAAEQPGGEYFQEVWRQMRLIAPGKPVSYSELAAAAGRPRAVRAAGTACAQNNLAPFVPCHRVVKSGGALGNYGYGVDAKAAMLALESNSARAGRAPLVASGR